MKTKKIAMFGVGLAVTVVALWYSTRQVKLADFIGEMKSFEAWWLVPGFLTFYFSVYQRAIRWGLLFRPHHRLSGWQMFRPIMICFGFNSVFPARVGEFVRAWLVGARQNTGVPTALATVLAERILDGLTLVGMLAFSLAVLPPMDPKMTFSQWGYTVSGAQFNELSQKIIVMSVILVVGVVVFMIPLTQRLMHRAIDLPPGLAGLKQRLHALLDQFARGFHALKEPWPLAQIVFHSVTLWVLVGVSNLLVAKGFGLPMSLAQSLALVTIAAIFIMIPAAPGYWGLFEVGTIFTLMVFQIVPPERQSLALAYALTIHTLQFLPVVVLGMIFAWQAQVRPAAVEAVAEAAEPQPNAECGMRNAE